MAKPTQAFSITFRDYDGELSNGGVMATTLTAANFDAQATARATYVTAVRAISIGEYAQSKVGIETIASAANASSVQAQRETKWLVRYHDANGYKFRTEVACADLTLLATNSEFMNPTALASFATAFEGYVKSPFDGSAVTVDSAQAVGRRT